TIISVVPTRKHTTPISQTMGGSGDFLAAAESPVAAGTSADARSPQAVDSGLAEYLHGPPHRTRRPRRRPPRRMYGGRPDRGPPRAAAGDHELRTYSHRRPVGNTTAADLTAPQTCGSQHRQPHGNRPAHPAGRRGITPRLGQLGREG